MQKAGYKTASVVYKEVNHTSKDVTEPAQVSSPPTPAGSINHSQNKLGIPLGKNGCKPTSRYQDSYRMPTG